METTISDFIRQTLDRITPEVLQGEKKLTPDNETRIILNLKKAAVKSFAAGKLAESKELSTFITSCPAFKIWPGNPVLFMQQNSSEPDNDKIIIYSNPEHCGQYEKLIEKATQIQSKYE